MLPPSDSTRRVWPLRLMAGVLFVLGILPMANLVAPGQGLQWWGQAVRLWILWSLVVVVLALLIARVAPRVPDALPALFEWSILRPSRRAFMLLLGAAVCLAGVFFSWTLFGLEALTIDELSLQWQGRLLASGRLYAMAERFPEFFSTTQTAITGGRWFTHFPIGPAAVLSAGVAVGVPWLVNPVLAAIAAVLVYRFLSATTGEAEARAVALLFAASPFVSFMAATQLDHVPALVAIWAAIAALPAWSASSTPPHARRYAAVIGAGLGTAAIIRPYDAALGAVVIALFQLREIGRNRALAGSLVVQIVAGCIPVALLLAANAATTGDPLTFAYDALAERSRFVFETLDRAPRAVSVPRMSVADQLALEPGRALAPACAAELATAVSNGADYARYLPRNETDDSGRLAGDVVFARDFGARNALLRERFGDRAWYRAGVERTGGVLRARVEPLPR